MTRQPQPQSGSTDPRLTRRLVGVSLVVALLTGCATSKDELMPTNGKTMQQLWEQGAVQGASSASAGTGGLGQQAVEAARDTLRRPIDATAMAEENTRYTRDAANEIRSQFSRLPNPDLVMFVYPHLAGGEAVPVPGYSTVFPLYTKPHYAMPGEGARPEGRTR